MAFPKGARSRREGVAVRIPRRKPKVEQQIGTAGRSPGAPRIRRASRKPLMK